MTGIVHFQVKLLDKYIKKFCLNVIFNIHGQTFKFLNLGLKYHTINLKKHFQMSTYNSTHLSAISEK